MKHYRRHWVFIDQLLFPLQEVKDVSLPLDMFPELLRHEERLKNCIQAAGALILQPTVSLNEKHIINTDWPQSSWPEKLQKHIQQILQHTEPLSVHRDQKQMLTNLKMSRSGHKSINIHQL